MNPQLNNSFGKSTQPRLEKPVAYLVYGNHGENPAHMHDYFNLFTEVFENAGVTLKFEKEIVPNAHNILIEAFSNNDCENILAIVEKHPDTKLACLCTEFVNGNTFNYFEPKDSFRHLVKLHNFLPPIAYKLGRFIFPKQYNKARSKYHSMARNDIVAAGSFKERFRNFERLVPYFEYIWCVIDHQIPDYKEHFRDSKIQYFPVATFRKSVRLHQKDEEKDIDILFSGVPTRERAEKLQKLADRGLKVICGLWSEDIRDHYLKRTKLCLHLKQKADWRFPSSMRLHHLLTSGNLVLAEKCEVKCMQEDFVISFTGDEYLDLAEDLILEKNFSEKARSNFDRYSHALKSDQDHLMSIVGEFINV